ncbi:MAG: beta-ketoacyl-[acyl-carrier-protein] synthase family protein [Verrucomicrobia bacterium]|nr:beta-ketoacyl-[acyl-carrier-protein] synthase family protein [Verrucomicrobiota bacterium]
MNTDFPPRRVVITGLGVVAPNGLGADAFWKSLRAGESAAGPITRFDASELPNRIACEVRNFDPGNFMERKKARRFELSIQYGIAAARLAMDDARAEFSQLDADRAGIVEGTSVAGTETILGEHEVYMQKGFRGVSPFTMVNAYGGSGCGEIALQLGIKGHAISLNTGSASGNDAVGYAFDMIRGDGADVMLAGGSEAPLVRPLFGAFCLTRVMSARNDTPLTAMRPFDKSRDGFVLGEGAGFLVLEELAHALGRGAKIYAEVLGHGRSCEAYHSVAPHPDGLGMHRAMEKALRQARLHVSEVTYVNAHATATELNDTAETKAIKSFFGGHAPRLAVSGTKPVTGHLLGAAGAVESVATALAIHHREIPATLNLAEPADGCDLDYVPGRARPYPIRVAMNLSCGFGGKNSCLVLKEFIRA